jgi:hypothetical protein
LRPQNKKNGLPPFVAASPVKDFSPFPATQGIGEYEKVHAEKILFCIEEFFLLLFGLVTLDRRHLNKQIVS